MSAEPLRVRFCFLTFGKMEESPHGKANVSQQRWLADRAVSVVNSGARLSPGTGLNHTSHRAISVVYSGARLSPVTGLNHTSEAAFGRREKCSSKGKVASKLSGGCVEFPSKRGLKCVRRQECARITVYMIRGRSVRPGRSETGGQPDDRASSYYLMVFYDKTLN